MIVPFLLSNSNNNPYICQFKKTEVMAKPLRSQDALDYHIKDRPGKIEVVPTKSTSSQRDLSLAYSPGVAEPCKRIHENPEDVYKYTAKGNLVAVISNGTAVLGLGNIGPEASKPVMEGKGVLFKVYADIDVFDLELNCNDVDSFVATVKALEPTFGGINLEDIKSPECFEIEEKLKKILNIPVMHDDQHGTAIISGAALLNALEVVGKNIDEIKMVVNGAGASAISCTRLILSLGVKKENIIMVDRKGVIRSDRVDLDENKSRFATDRDLHTLEDALDGADFFLGLSVGGVLKPHMILKMAENPIIFALANPEPEIDYNLAMQTRSDIVMATGRSDYPNQVNNVLGFPYIFRGALDVRARFINEEMKIAAVKALASLARKPVPDIVTMAYDLTTLTFGKDYIIPKPMDHRLMTHVAPAVAKAAMESGVARKEIKDWEGYNVELRKRLGLDNKIIRIINNRARKAPKRVVFTEADNPKILKAAQISLDEGFAIPILLGDEEKIKSLIKDHNIDLPDCRIINPLEDQARQLEYGQFLYDRRKRKGVTLDEAIKLMRSRSYFGNIMVAKGEADALISGLTKKYTETLKPALQVIGVEEGVKKVIGMYILMSKKGPLFLADTTVNVNPTVEELVNITELTHKAVKEFNINPRIALLSFSNFGSSNAPNAWGVGEAVRILKERNPKMIVDGEIQANFALNEQLLQEFFPFSDLVNGGANTLIFPNLGAGNISYKILQEAGNAEALGPVLIGLKKSVHVLQLGSSIREIANMIALAVMDAQNKS